MTERNERSADIYLLKEPLSANENEEAASTAPLQTEGCDALMNDHELLSAYAHGEELAFETLVKKYFRMVYTVAVRHTGDSHLAEEIAQSAFLILSRKARGFSPRASVPGWLLRTTRFVCRDAIKMRRRREKNERNLAVNLEQQPATKAELNGVEALLDEAIQTLRPEEQAGIFARFFEGKDFQEIAEMFAISEHAARKRTSRCLAKLQNFMARRGAKISLSALAGLLAVPAAQEAASQALQAAIHSTQVFWKGKAAVGKAFVLAERATRLLRWQFLTGLGLKLALPVVVICVCLWPVREWTRPTPYKIEKLGKAWGALDRRVAEHRQFLMQTPPDAAGYVATLQQGVAAINRESSRVIRQLSPLLAPPDDRARLTMFLTAELAETLSLDPSQKANVSAYIQERLERTATLTDGMKLLAERTPMEASEIKAMLSPSQQQVFDQLYGADGVLLFSYPKAVALGKIGP